MAGFALARSIPTWAPAPGPVGAEIAALREAEVLDYEAYSWAAASMTSVDAAALADRVSAPIASPELRRAMGEAGRKRASETFDWANVFRQYQELWSDLDERRRAALDKPEPAAWLKAAPSAAPDALDPFHALRHYPTARIEALASAANIGPSATATYIATLAKIGVVELRRG